MPISSRPAACGGCVSWCCARYPGRAGSRRCRSCRSLRPRKEATVHREKPKSALRIGPNKACSRFVDGCRRVASSLSATAVLRCSICSPPCGGVVPSSVGCVSMRTSTRHPRREGLAQWEGPPPRASRYQSSRPSPRMQRPFGAEPWRLNGMVTNVANSISRREPGCGIGPAAKSFRCDGSSSVIPVVLARSRPSSDLGVETQRQWSDLAILRTTPALLGLYSLITLWASERLDERATPYVAAWYAKSRFTFSDAIAAVRLNIWVGDIYSRSTVSIDQQKIPPNRLIRIAQAIGHAA